MESARDTIEVSSPEISAIAERVSQSAFMEKSFEMPLDMVCDATNPATTPITLLMNRKTSGWLRLFISVNVSSTGRLKSFAIAI